jgi:hypothetical protein
MKVDAKNQEEKIDRLEVMEHVSGFEWHGNRFRCFWLPAADIPLFTTRAQHLRKKETDVAV